MTLLEEMEIMKTYGTNSAGAVIRLLALANAVNRDVSSEQISLLAQLAAHKVMAKEDILRIVAEYERDLLVAQQTEKQFFIGDGLLPRGLVEGALKEIDGTEMQLQVVQLMFGLLMSGKGHAKNDVFFVENCVNFWGISGKWREWLRSLDEPEVISGETQSVK